jgi:hypothetical protein
LRCVQTTGEIIPEVIEKLFEKIAVPKIKADDVILKVVRCKMMSVKRIPKLHQPDKGFDLKIVSCIGIRKLLIKIIGGLSKSNHSSS